MSSAERRKAFLIGPIGDRDADPGTVERLTYEDAVGVLDEIVRPALESNGFEAIRADWIARPGEIPEQIFRHLRDQELVIADLTGANPNVMYELGLRHASGRLTIQIGERGRLPFDVAAIRTILFKRTEAGFIRARHELTEAIREAVAEGGDPVTATRIWFEQPGLESVAESMEYRQVPEQDSAADEEEDGFLEVLVAAEDGWKEVANNLNLLTAIAEEIGNTVRDGATQADRVNKQGGDSAAKLFVANRLAQQLEEPASRIEVVVGAYRVGMGRVNAGMTYILERLRAETKAHTDADEFVSSILNLSDSAASALSRIGEFRESLREVGQATKSLRRVATRIATSLQHLVDSSEPIQRWRAELLDLQGPVA